MISFNDLQFTMRQIIDEKEFMDERNKTGSKKLGVEN